MKWIRRHSVIVLVLTLIVFVYFASRFYGIMDLPMFTDESIYARWTKIARFDAKERFISLEDGKQPSFIWAAMIVMRFVGEDPLLAGRLVSVFAGFATLIGIYFLTREFFRSNLAGVLASFLYLIFPMAIVYDRMALYESLVGAFSVWSVFLIAVLIRTLRLDVALLLGMVLGGGMLTKTSAFFNLYLLPFSLILFDLKELHRLKRFAMWFMLATLAGILAFVYYSILRLAPLNYMINQKNAVFVYPFNEWITHPFNFFVGNINGQWDWLITYLTWPLFILSIVSFLIRSSFTKQKLVLAVWFFIPFVLLALFARTLYPRFIFAMAIFLLPLAAATLFEIANLIKNKVVVILLYAILFILPIRVDQMILTNFARSPIPKLDREQYINSWPAGGGIREIIAFLEQQAKKEKIYVASEGTFGAIATNAVEIYLGDNKNVGRGGIWPLPKGFPDDLVIKSKTMLVYFIFNETQNIPPEWPLSAIASYRKGVGNSYMRLYQVIPD
ncbi:MAG: glycosyltransferase family 39 protein [Candidatus Levybacteria bacterium]|nr:glycosyltransferase family 39 protein [Candidatus Levybacteria bacterium]